MTFKITDPIIEPTEGSPHQVRNTALIQPAFSFTLLLSTLLRRNFVSSLYSSFRFGLNRYASYRSYPSFSY